MTTKNIFKCSKCKGQKVRTRTQGMVCLNCKPPRTGRIEKKGDREKLEKVLKKINKNNLKNKKTIKRSGDHYLHQVDKMINGEVIKHNGVFTFGVGEASNHNHNIVVKDPKNLVIIKDEQGNYYFDLKEDAFLMHVEGDSMKVADHKTIPIKKGIYKQVHEREVDVFSQTVRKVID